MYTLLKLDGILDGCISAYIRENSSFRRKNMVSNQIKCLKQIKCHRLLLTGAPNSELPSSISTLQLLQLNSDLLLI